MPKAAPARAVPRTWTSMLTSSLRRSSTSMRPATLPPKACQPVLSAHCPAICQEPLERQCLDHGHLCSHYGQGHSHYGQGRRYDSQGRRYDSQSSHARSHSFPRLSDVVPDTSSDQHSYQCPYQCSLQRSHHRKADKLLRRTCSRAFGPKSHQHHSKPVELLVSAAAVNIRRAHAPTCRPKQR